MRSTLDTWLHFLADNLPGVTIHPRRYDPNNPSLMDLQENAINVEFGDVSLDEVASQQVVLDIIFTDELQAYDLMQSVWNLLRAAFYTPLMDYTNPAAPVPGKGNLMWDRNSVKFRRVYADFYCHYSCTMNLKFQTY